MDVSLADPTIHMPCFYARLCWHPSRTPSVVTSNPLNPSPSLGPIHGDINCLFSWYIVEILITSYGYEECSAGITSEILYPKRNLMMSCPESHVTSIQFSLPIWIEWGNRDEICCSWNSIKLFLRLWERRFILLSFQFSKGFFLRKRLQYYILYSRKVSFI